jgi:hypothetical protein
MIDCGTVIVNISNIVVVQLTYNLFAGVLRDLRLEYERDGAVVIESRALRVLRSLGREELLHLFVPLAASLCCAVAKTDFVACAVMLVVSSEGAIDWESDWKSHFTKTIVSAKPDTLLRENSGVLAFTVQYLSAHGKLWLANLAKNVSRKKRKNKKQKRNETKFFGSMKKRVTII